jgi:AraC-like DNA-binding protein
MVPPDVRLFDQLRTSDGGAAADRLIARAQWLEAPGCLFQPSDFVSQSRIRVEAVARPGFFVTVVIEGAGPVGPRKSGSKLRCTDQTILAIALREPTPWAGEVPRGATIRAAGLAFPLSSIDRLGLKQDFLALFSGRQGGPALFALKAPPRLLAIAGEMLRPGVDGRAGELLLAAHATEILARTIAAARQGSTAALAGDRKRGRLETIRAMIDADLKRRWSIAELARHAGVSRRSFNTQFRRAFGVTAFDYLRTRRLETAREAIVAQGLSVNEAAYLAGYSNPANFATAFRKHFGHAPSRIRL